MVVLCAVYALLQGSWAVSLDILKHWLQLRVVLQCVVDLLGLGGVCLVLQGKNSANDTRFADGVDNWVTQAMSYK